MTQPTAPATAPWPWRADNSTAWGGTYYNPATGEAIPQALWSTPPEQMPGFTAPGTAPATPAETQPAEPAAPAAPASPTAALEVQAQKAKERADALQAQFNNIPDDGDPDHIQQRGKLATPLTAAIREAGTLASQLATANARNPLTQAQTDLELQKVAAEKRLQDERDYNSVAHPAQKDANGQDIPGTEQPAVGPYTHDEVRRIKAADAATALATGKADETTRHNQQTETQAGNNATEAQRHNQQIESQAAGNATAAQAHNQQMEVLQAARDKANQDAAVARTQWEQQKLDLQQQLDTGRLSLDQYKAEYDKAHVEASDKAQAARDANAAFNDALTQAGNAETRTETTRHNQATETNAATATQNAATAQNDATSINAATLLQRQQSEDATREATQRANNATLGQSILKDTAANALSANNSIFNTATSAKNYGLGSTADISQLPQAAQAWATQMAGGQSMLDQAAQMVHAANPQMAGTPLGSQLTATLQQILERRQQLDKTPPFTAPGTPGTPQPAGTPAPAANAEPSAPQAGAPSPSDPDYLGKVIGAAIAHIGGSAPGQRGGLDSFQAPSSPIAA